MWIVQLALRRPYTFIVLALLVLIVGPLTILRTPVDIFPNINIPVVSVIWRYTGLSSEEMEGRMIAPFEQGDVGDRQRHRAHRVAERQRRRHGQGVLPPHGQHPDRAGADRCHLSNDAGVVSAGTTPPLILQYTASTVPILQLALSSSTIAEHELNDTANSFMRTQLATVQGAVLPYPYGGKMRQVMVDIDPKALQAKNLGPQDVVDALGLQNLILPSGTVKIGDLEYDVALNGSPKSTDVVDPLVVPPNVGLVAPDRTAVRLVATVPGDNTEIGERLEPVPAFVDQLRADYPGFTIHALNNTLANDDISELVNKDLDASLQITIPLTFFILLVAFGAVVAAAVPLILAMTALLAAFGVLGLYSQFVTPVSPYASQLVVLIGLAVAVDYSLFMLTRFRSERRRHPAPLQQPTRNDYLRRVVLVVAAIGALVIAVVVDAAAVRIVVAAVIGGIVIWSISRLMERGDETGKLSAIQTASSTAGRAVFFSGLAVMISIAGLFLLDDPLFRSMAVGTISVVFISVVGSLTFLPAVLAILGDGINGGRLPILGRPRPEGSGMWARIVRTTMRRPVLSFVLSAGFLLVLASPALRLHIGQSDFASFPDEIDSVQALNLMNEKWPQGSTLALQVVVTKADQPATKAAIDELTKRLLAIEGLSEPVETRTSQDGTVAMVSYVMAGGAERRGQPRHRQ